MQTPTKKTRAAHNGKGFLALAGEALSVLGEEIVEGKDKVVEVAAEKFTAVKKAVKKFAHKKTPARSVKKKATSAGKAAVKKVAGKKTVVKKAVAAPKKPAKKTIKKGR
jgi:hypothetical protein